MWLKYRTKEASGLNGDFEWKFLGTATPDPEAIKEFISDIDRQYEWSDLYRGVEHSIETEAPIEVLENLIKETEASIRHMTRVLDKLRSLRGGS